MVNASLDKQGYTGHILLEPNLSLTWQANKIIFIIITCLTMVIGGYFASIGGWLVLPFSGLELIVIAISVYMFFSRNNHCEVIIFTNNKVIVERGKTMPEKSFEYQRHWSQIYIKEHGLYDIPKVSIKSHGKETELGAFLGYDEKIQFIDILKNITSAFRQSNAFHQHSHTAD